MPQSQTTAIKSKNILVTGGCGFIGSNFLNLFVPKYPSWRFINVDKLTYAGNPSNLTGIESCENYVFERIDICDETGIKSVFEKNDPTCVIHFAAESHVDRSILGPVEFAKTNIMGTLTLLEACRAHWTCFDDRLFLHVSTDEVYGSLGPTGSFEETTAYDPSSPYSASKAGADHLVRAYYRTYGLPVKITNCSNNFGPYQFPEKLIPLMILNAVNGKPLPVYGDGLNVRDWLYVTDHCDALMRVVLQGKTGETYNIGGDCEMTNLQVVQTICNAVAEATGQDASTLLGAIEFVDDRPGHDYRYAINAAKLKRELDWSPEETFGSGIQKTVNWYLKHPKWVDSVVTGEYLKWIETQYPKTEIR